MVSSVTSDFSRYLESRQQRLTKDYFMSPTPKVNSALKDTSNRTYQINKLQHEPPYVNNNLGNATDFMHVLNIFQS